MSTVFVNGCFDLLHPGHVHFLEEAAKHGRLIVAVNTDASVTKLKGKPPQRSFVERIKMLQAVRCVDYTVGFHGPNACSTIEVLRPDIYVTGSEYKGRSPEARQVLDYGGKVFYIDRIGDYSSTKESQRGKH